jgi:exodeoxyribonuclease VII large subunit
MPDLDKPEPKKLRYFLMFSTPPEPAAWSVSDLTSYIRELFEIDFRLQDVEVSGEISNFIRARSGHLYFTLKDDRAQLKGVMWRSDAQRLRFNPADGDAVVARGSVSVYEAGGVYQLYANSLQPAGRGDLAQLFEQLKQQLEGEGLFDPARKQPIPVMPGKIGIVTSADAAALRDILHTLRRRWPLVAVLVAATLVQGREAPPQIVRALNWLDGRNDIDTIIIARGGGSLEDLWAFNDEQVVRAIAAARHPIIAGIGHETDFTLADFAADLRAPTPTAAAELAAPDQAEIRQRLAGAGLYLRRQIDGWLAERRRSVQVLSRALGHLSPQANLNNNRQRLDHLSGRLDQAAWRILERRENRLALLQTRLTAVSPLATLARGYAIVRHADGRYVHSVQQLRPGDPLRVQLSDGEFAAAVASTAAVEEN